MTQYARINHGQAFVFLPFGRTLANKYFGADFIDSLPVFSKGKHKGQPKAQITWRKVEVGGWVREGEYGNGHVERRTGQIITMELREAVYGKPAEQQTVIKSWVKE